MNSSRHTPDLFLLAVSDSTDDINDVNALIESVIVDVRAITPAIRPLGFSTVLFTCPWLINVNSIALTKKNSATSALITL